MPHAHRLQPSFADAIATTCNLDVFRHYSDIADEFFVRGHTDPKAYDVAFRFLCGRIERMNHASGERI